MLWKKDHEIAGESQRAACPVFFRARVAVPQGDAIPEGDDVRERRRAVGVVPFGAPRGAVCVATAGRGIQGEL